ncbi:hypothetical protein [Nesterenkonia sphaerica]|uniref:Uncharacterized protein n=1 Tax=Nesterenkonia sphaerica TaxID=1804988 RepID=A0A5R9A345_9MICC|nr:hypothetical protein [Nesterenkonia sphaerica]TLP72960.1 hypothetical protein FEF27_11060 [Nesterenkonia sphaerica]
MSTTATTQPTEQRPGLHRQADIRTAENDHPRKAALMTNDTPVPAGFAPTGLTVADLETLASHIGVKVEDHPELPEGYWGGYNANTRTIDLLAGLAHVQRRDTLAVMLAHARLTDNSPGGYTSEEAHTMAARMIITTEDWEVIGPVWEECQKHDPQRVFRLCRVLPSTARDYARVAGQWHPEGCIDWDGLCGRDDDDDIHSFAPTRFEIADTTIRVSPSLNGTLGGQERLDPGMGLEIDLPWALRDCSGGFHATPEQARQLAAFLIAQADRVDAWTADHGHLFDRERELATVGAGGDRDG